MKVPSGLYFKTQMMIKFKWLYKSLGDVESALLKSELNDIKIKKPVYVTGLARSGTTIITEILSKTPEAGCHTYGDFPGVFTPYWNNWLRQKKQFVHAKKVERSHKDRIKVNNDSAEAFEEVLWMYFYPYIHNKGIVESVKLNDHDGFVDYYQQHIKKLLLIKEKSRYLTKANYNINRITDILSIFPDAKVIVPIRHPVNHIASLMKQHDIYLKAGKNNSRIDRQLAASGHFEFGQLREMVKIKDSDYAEKVQQLWSQGREIQGWAHYWQGLYGAIHTLKKNNDQCDRAIQFVQYELLCGDSIKTIDEMIAHCQFKTSGLDALKEHYHKRLTLPDYYQHQFNEKEISEILQITSAVSEKFGYNECNYN